MAKDTNINIRVNSETKAKTESILNDLGLSLSSAIDIYLVQIIKEKGIPFKVKLPTNSEVEKSLKLGKIINSLGGVDTNPKLEKIVQLYARGDISYKVAVFAIKEELKDI
ncbi:MAG: type II toxin-antitoxin system RelB/DinJ family antitoxin [Bacilli bacterium]|nr:type II toxin-antitoxin system RelB/DinJ family antitoxin [Bacilli bacterium]